MNAPGMRVVEGQDALAALVRVYMAGFEAGMGSTLATFHIGPCETARDEYVFRFVDDLLEDPAIRETIHGQILAALNDHPRESGLAMPLDLDEGDEK